MGPESDWVFWKNEKLKWKNEEENFHHLHFHFSYDKTYITVFLDLSSHRIYNFFSHGTPTVENMKGFLGSNKPIFGQKTANFDEFRLTKPLIVATIVVPCQKKLYIRDEDRLRNTLMYVLSYEKWKWRRWKFSSSFFHFNFSFFSKESIRFRTHS